MDLALTIQQRLICHETQTNTHTQKTNILKGMMSILTWGLSTVNTLLILEPVHHVSHYTTETPS